MRLVCLTHSDTAARKAAHKYASCPAWLTGLLVVAAALLLLTRTLHARENIHSLATVGQSSELTPDDCRLTLSALAALTRDKQLASLNVGVTVRDNMATLWGPVPSPALGRRAEEVVRQVPGIGGVVNELHVERPDDSRKDVPRGLSRTKATPKAEVPTPDKPLPLPALMARWQPHDPAPATESTWRPLAAGLGPVHPGLAAHAGPPMGAAQPALPAQQATMAVMPSLLIPHPPVLPGARPAEFQRLLLIETRPNRLGQAMDQLILGNPRYRRIQAEICKGVVYLHGIVLTRADLHELARTISQIPGVQRVILDDVRTDAW